MKALANKLLSNMHWFILIYGLYGVYIKWEEHSVQLEGIESQYAALEADTVKTKKNMQEIEENKGKINEFKVRVEEVAKNIEDVQKQLPADINDIQITTFLKSEMESISIRQTKIDIGNEVPGTYFISKDYNLKGEGTFLQFLVFFEKIGSASRIYNVKSLTLTTKADVQKGRYKVIEGQGVVQAFRFNPAFKVDLGFDKVETPPEVKQ